MPKKSAKFSSVQPINWGRAFFCGIFGALGLLGVMDSVFMAGYQKFSLELFLGSLFTQDRFDDPGWMLGFFLCLFLGGMFGILYSYFFEYQFKRVTVRLGLVLSGIHLFVLGAFVLPFIHMLHQELETGLYPHLGPLGLSLGIATPLTLVVGHLLFGATMGLFYGAVQPDREQIARWEPDFQAGRVFMLPTKQREPVEAVISDQKKSSI
jgi:hypothetical protein